jgi:hypothetical protein
MKKLGRRFQTAEQLTESLNRRLDMRHVITENGCWNWIGPSNGNGYGRISNGKGRFVYVHRASYERHVGPIPAGREIDHLCRNRACINPAHLEPVTSQVNTQRGLKGDLKMYCNKGHLRTPENTSSYQRYTGKTTRYCLICKHEADRKNRQRLKGL